MRRLNASHWACVCKASGEPLSVQIEAYFFAEAAGRKRKMMP